MIMSVPLRAYVEHVYRELAASIAETRRELQTELDRRLTEQKEAARDLAASLNARLLVMNEFRSAMADLSASKVSRDLFDAEAKAQDKRMRTLENRLTLIETADQVQVRRRDNERSEFQGRQTSLQSRVLIIGVVIALVTVVVTVLIALYVH
jgi:hypothetical protein